MHIIIVTYTGDRIFIEIEQTDTIQVLKDKIKNFLKITDHTPRLVFNGRDLDDSTLVSSYNIRKESVINMNGTQRGGVSIPLSFYTSNDIPLPEEPTPETDYNYRYDKNEDGRPFVSFKPITNKSKIPYYDEITRQPYHHGVSDEDKVWISKYTSKDYRRLKAQSYILNPDDHHMRFLKGLYLACWCSFQTDLPDIVYHICYLTDTSFDWYDIGMVFYTPAFVSTSRKNNLPWFGNCQWVISLSKGKRHHAVDVMELSNHRSEEEILISCCTKFKVVGKERLLNDQKFKYKVFLEYLDLEDE